MDKIKRFITCFVPINICNFDCMYCYLNDFANAKHGGWKGFVLPPEELAASLSQERLGGPCYFNLCGTGETMLHPQLNALVAALTAEGHYADIITNGTLSNRFDELLSMLDAEQRQHLFIKFSFHYLELLRKKKMDVFLSNVARIRDAHISYTIEITPHDELIPYIDEVKAFSLKHFGALPHITVARTEGKADIPILSKLSREEYYRVWSQFDSELFRFKFRTFNEHRHEFCYAGDWSFCLDLASGAYTQCYVGKRLGYIQHKGPLHLQAIGHCREPHCFNGHAFLTLGDIPELNAPTYAAVRDRVTASGEHWLQPKVAAFFNTTLHESNAPYSTMAKARALYQTNLSAGKQTCGQILKKFLPFQQHKS